jgi:hypothetical protein
MKKIIVTAVAALTLFAGVNAVQAAFTWTPGQSLIRVGSRGQQVMDLQICLAALDNNPASNIDGIFGPITASAVMSFQAENGLMVDGIIGPQTGPFYTAACDMDMDEDDEDDDSDSDDFPTFGGDEASLEDFDMESEDDAEEGEMMHVATFEFDVEDGDFLMERVDVTFDNAGVGGTADDEPWDVFETITLMVDGDEIAEEDIDEEDDWNEDDNPFQFRITGLDYVVEEDETVEVEIYLTAENNVDDPANADWEIYIDDEGVRGIDTAGITQYTGDTADTVSFGVDEEGGDEDLVIKSSNNDPDSALLQVDEDDEEWYEVFVFELEAEENDIDVETIVLEVITTDGDYADLVNDMKVEIDGEEFDDFAEDLTDPDAAR